MKNFLRFLNLFIVVAFMASCASDDVALDNVQNDDNVISFTFSGLNYGGITYATIATAPENQADNLDVYMFEYSITGDGQFHHKWNSDDSDFTITQTGLTTQTISLGNGNAYGPGAKKFYFVANPNPTTELNASNEAQFVESLTKGLATTDGKGDLLATPLLFTGSSDAIDPLNPVSNAVTMKRRVARFDIVNDYENFVVEKVFVSNAKLQGYVFGNARGTESPTMPTASLKEITTIPDYITENNERISRSVFYLYPTTISKTKTEIAIQASLNGEPSDLYYLDPTNSEIGIDANCRYKLVIHKDIAYGTYAFNLVYADWDEGTKIDVKETNKLELTDIKFDPDHDNQKEYWNEADKIFNTTKSNATEMTFTVNNPLNLRWEAKVVEGDPSHVKTMPILTSTPTLTYGAEVSHECKVTLPEYNETLNQTVTIRLRIQNSARLEEYTDIFFKREPTIRLSLKRTKSGLPFNDTHVPYGLRVFYFPSQETAYDRKWNYDDIPTATAVSGIYDTKKDNITHGWTVVSWANDPNLEWNDYHDPGDTFDITKLEAAVKKHPNHPGYYMPIASNSYNLWWKDITIEQGVSLENPFPVNHSQTTAAVKVVIEQTNLALDPDTGEPIDPNELWIAIDNQARACDFTADENIVRGDLPLAVPLAVDKPDISGTTATWGYFGTFGTVTSLKNDPAYNLGIRVMYRDHELAHPLFPKTNITVAGDPWYVFTIKFTSSTSLTILLQVNGWDMVDMTVEI